MRLFRSELLRARSRRLVPMVIIGGLLAIVVSMTIAAFNSHAPTQAALDQAQRNYDQQFQRCLSGKYLGRDGELPPGYASMDEFCREQRVGRTSRTPACRPGTSPRSCRGSRRS